jgi:hypothetical protein
VNRDIGTAFLQGHIEFFDKQALATDFGQTAVQNLIALGGHAQQTHLASPLLEQGFDMFSLPKGQTAFSGGNDDGGSGIRRHVEFLDKWASSR